MGIEFHCTRCNKLIRAPDSHGGKRGKCPYCKGSVYVPTPPQEGEEIDLAPVDEKDERTRAELEAETRRLQGELAREDQDPSESRGSARGGGEWSGRGVQGEPGVDVGPLVIRFVRAMQGSLLDEAEEIVAELKPHVHRAREHIQALMVDEMPAPGLENIPPGLYKGFLRTLLERL